MDAQKYKDFITGLVKEPEKAAEAAAAFMSTIDEDGASFDALKAKVAEQDEKIKSLQDANIRLFLSVTGQAEQEQEEEEPKTGINWEEF